MNMVVPILLVVTTIVTGQLLLKSGMSRVGSIGGDEVAHPLEVVRRVLTTWQVVAGLTLYVASALAWIWVLSRVELSFAFPFLALSYVGVTVLAVIRFRERFSAVQWLGLALTVTGVVLVASTGG